MRRKSLLPLVTCDLKSGNTEEYLQILSHIFLLFPRFSQKLPGVLWPILKAHEPKEHRQSWVAHGPHIAKNVPTEQ